MLTSRSVFLDRFRDEGPSDVHSIFDHLSNNSHYHLHRHRHRRLLLLRLICGIASLGICGYHDEESLLRSGTPWSHSHRDDRLACEYSPFSQPFSNTNIDLAPRQIHFYPPPSRIAPPYQQLLHPLGRLAELHWRLCSDLVRYRKRHPGLRGPGLPHRSPPGHSHVFPTNGIHVAA